MRHELIRFSDENENLLNRLTTSEESGSNSRDRVRMRKIICSSIIRELTDIQRYCVTEHYLNHKKQCEIAEDLGVSRSTVCRHISRAMRKLRNIASYYC